MPAIAPSAPPRLRCAPFLRWLLAVVCLVPGVAPVAAQDAGASADERFVAEIRALLADARVQDAFQRITDEDASTIADLVELTEIPAPPFMEAQRAARFLAKVRELGVDSAWIDAEGNVLALRRGTDADAPVLALTGHLDTVFPEGTDVTVRERGDTLYAPGIGDDTRGLAGLLAVLRAMNGAGIHTVGDVLFVATTGEEGLGDLRGVKHLFREGGPRIDAFISVDGTSPDRVTHQALGSYRYRVTFRGEGGHSWGAFGLANPVHALGRAVRLFDERAPAITSSGPRTSYNVGRIGGGTSVNSIPFEAWMEVDMRSESPEALDRIDAVLLAAIDEALEQENAEREGGQPVTADVERIGTRPSGSIDERDPLVQRAVAATSALGRLPTLGRSSTDSNIPISLGIPAVTIGAGGGGGNSHALDEWYLNVNGPLGVQRILLITVAQAGLADAVQADHAAGAHHAHATPSPEPTLPPSVLGQGGPLRGTHVNYFAADPAARGYLAVPEGPGPFPALVIVHEWDGLKDRVRQLADDLADEGYVVLAADLFSGRVGTSPQENVALVREAQADMPGVIANLDAAVATLRARPDVTGRVGAMGWCFGGGIALSYGLDGENHEATAIFYGRLIDDPAALARIDHEVYGTFARLDNGPSPDQVAAFEQALRAAGIPNDLHIYDDVGHGFWLRVDEDPETRTAPALDAWERLKSYFDRTLRGSGG